jgi:hypothetical protein
LRGSAARAHLQPTSSERDTNPVVKRVNLEGQALQLDTNSTPGCGGQSTPRLEAIADELAAGLVDAAKSEERSAGAH